MSVIETNSAAGAVPTQGTDAHISTSLAVPDERSEIAMELAQDPERERLDFPDWYLSVLGNCDAAEARLKLQYERIKAQIDARRKALEWRFGQDFRARVEQDLTEQKGKRRSVDYLGGRAGFRKSPLRVIVRDKEAVINWASVNVPEAVKLEPALHVTPLKAHYLKTGEVPDGTEIVPESDRFYPAALPGLPGPSDGANGHSDPEE